MANRRMVLSLFPGIGSLDVGFERAGFCVVTAGDLAWSSLFDIRNFHPPRARFDGVIGGDPCQAHSLLAHLVRAKGLEPTFPDLTPEFERVIDEAKPLWFLRENVIGAPEIAPEGYTVASFLLDHSTLDAGGGTGHEQIRRRRFWFGTWGSPVPELRAHLDFALTLLPEGDHLEGPAQKGHRRPAVCGDPRSTFIPGGATEVAALREGEISSVTRPATAGPRGTANPARAKLDELLALQGLPPDLLEHSPLTMQGKRTMVGNAVPLPMAEALGRAVRAAMSGPGSPG